MATDRTLLDLVRGGTFDDFLLRPQYSVLERRDPATIDLSAPFSQRITLKRPIVSASMDTVTRAPMAIVQAEEGGLGIIDRGFKSGDGEDIVRPGAIVAQVQGAKGHRKRVEERVTTHVRQRLDEHFRTEQWGHLEPRTRAPHR
jgi:IMP dehydrogenase/GMP reductase